MRLDDGQVFCALCGTTLDVDEAETVTSIAGASAMPNVRILRVDGFEIHRCEIPSRGRRRPSATDRPAALRSPTRR